MSRRIPASTKLQFLIIFLFRTVPCAVSRILGAAVRAWLKNLPLGASIWNGFAGALMINTPPQQLQAILPSTIDTYNAWILSHGAIPAIDVLMADNSTRLLWIGPKCASKVVLFFHGTMSHHVLPETH